MDPLPHILIVDDDDRLRALLVKFLSERQLMVTAAAGAAEARRKMAWFAFDLLVLDVMMPDETGLELLASLPASRPPVLVLSARGEAEDRIKGLEVGADDYLPKPFEPKELVLRIGSILRRSATQRKKAKVVTFAQFDFDLAAGSLKRGGETIALTTGEAALLKMLAARAGEPVSREDLAASMPGAASERSVDVQVTRLRKKIEGGGKPLYLQTVRGAGYVLYAD